MLTIFSWQALGALWGTVNETHVQSKRPPYCAMALVPIKHCFKGEVRLYALSSLVKKKGGGEAATPSYTSHPSPKLTSAQNKAQPRRGRHALAMMHPEMGAEGMYE